MAHSSDKLVDFNASVVTVDRAGDKTDTHLVQRRSSNEFAMKWFETRLGDCRRRSGSLRYTYKNRDRLSPFFLITFEQNNKIANAEHFELTILLVRDTLSDKENDGKNEETRFVVSRSELSNLELSKRFCTMVDFLSDSIVTGESTDSAGNTLRHYTDLLQEVPRKRRLRLCGLFVVPRWANGRASMILH